MLFTDYSEKTHQTLNGAGQSDKQLLLTTPTCTVFLPGTQNKILILINSGFFAARTSLYYVMWAKHIPSCPNEGFFEKKELTNIILRLYIQIHIC